MGLRKCPRCELNYIRDDEQLCNVCKRHMKGEAETDDVVTICTECGENPAVRGSELCAMCLREARRQENLEKRADDLTGSSVVDDMDGIDELEVPIDDDIPEIEPHQYSWLPRIITFLPGNAAIYSISSLASSSCMAQLISPGISTASSSDTRSRQAAAMRSA